MDMRYKFIRSENPFNGLPDYNYSKEFGVKNTNIDTSSYPTKSHISGDAVNARLGACFELIAHAQYGGRMQKHCNSNGYESEDPSAKVFHPDLIDLENNIRREIKSVLSGRSLVYKGRQLGHHALMQRDGDQFSKNPLLKFEIYRHRLRNITAERSKSLESLAKDVSRNIMFQLSLPFEIFFKLYNAEGNISSIYEDAKPILMCQILSSVVNDFLAYPEEVLERLNMNLDRLVITKRRFPYGITINGVHRIKPFPIMSIDYKNRKSEQQFLAEFREKYKNHTFEDFVYNLDPDMDRPF